MIRQFIDDPRPFAVFIKSSGRGVRVLKSRRPRPPDVDDDQGDLSPPLRVAKLRARPLTPRGTFAFSRLISANASGVNPYSSTPRTSGLSESLFARNG